MQRALFVAVVVSLALYGCGEQSPNERRPAPTAAATPDTADGDRIAPSARGTVHWVRRANAICRQAQPEWAALALEFERVTHAKKAGAPGWRQREAAVHGKYNRIVTGIFEQLQDLPRPDKDPRPGQVLAAYGQIVSHLDLAVGYYDDGTYDSAFEFARAALAWQSETQQRGRRIGLTECFPGLRDPNPGISG